MSEHLSAPAGVGVLTGLDGAPFERTAGGVVAERAEVGSVVDLTANPNPYRTSSDLGGRA